MGSPRLSLSLTLLRPNSIEFGALTSRLGQPAQRAGYRGDALNDGGPWDGDFALLECNHGQHREGFEHSPGRNKKSGVRGRPRRSLPCAKVS